MKKYPFFVGLMLILIGLFLLFALVEGIQADSLVARPTFRVDPHANPLWFWIVACIYAIAGVGNLGIGWLLTRGAFKKRGDEIDH